MHPRRLTAALVALLTLTAACSPATTPASGPQGGAPSAPAAPKHITVSILSDPPFLFPGLNPPNAAGSDALYVVWDENCSGAHDLWVRKVE